MKSTGSFHRIPWMSGYIDFARRAFLCAGMAFFMLSAVPSAAQADKQPRVMLFPLTVWAEGGSVAYISRQVADTLFQGLASDCGVKIEPYAGNVPIVLPDERKTAAEAVSADFALWGSVTSLGNSFSIDLSLLHVPAGGTVRRLFAQGDTPEQMADAVRRLSVDVCTVVSGRKRIEKIEVQGNERIEADAVLRVVGVREGDIFSREKLSADLSRVYTMGYFEDVRVEAEDTAMGKRVVFIVKERPTVNRITISKYTVFSEEEIKEEIPIKRGAILNILTVQESVKRIEQLYKGKNYHNVRVTYEIKEDKNNQADLEFIIDRGDKFMVREIRFVGNSAYKEKELRKIIKTKKKGFFWWITSSGDLNMDQLRQDVAMLSNHYYNNGYIDARVGDPEIEYADKRIRITFKIEEGQQFSVGKVDLSGDVGEDAPELKKLLKISGETYFNRSLVRADVLALTDFYADKGYFYADAIPDVRKNDTDRVVDITYIIEKGGLVYFDDILITGNTKTRDKVIRRELDVYEQELYSGSRLKKGVGRLYRLNYFENLKVDTVEGTEPDKVDLKIEVEEKPTGMFSFGGGYSSVESLFATASISQQNLFGRGQVLSLQGQVGGTSTEYKLSFTEPYLFDTRLSAGVDAYDWNVDADTYDRQTIGGGLRFGYPLFENTRLYLSYTYDVNKVDNVSAYAPFSIQELALMGSQSVTSGVSSSLVYDSRDNYMNPTRGGKHSVTMENTGGPLGGDVAFTKYTGETGWYQPLFWEFVGFAHAKG
ncbi:MAG: outer membrane protein assembly factor BamA, partial [Thermodesulfobacteriota bacterium]